MILENTLTEEAKNELNKIKGIEEKVDSEKVVYRTNKYKYDFTNFQTLNTFGREIYSSKITLKEGDDNQSSLLVEIMNSRQIQK